MADQTYKFLNETVTANPDTNQVSSVVAADNMAPVKPLVVPTDTPQTGGADALVASVQPTVNDFAKQLTPAPTELDTQRANLDAQNQQVYNQLAQLIGQDTGQSQYRAQQQEAAGANKFQKELTDLNGQITVGNAEYNQLLAKQQQEQAALGGNGTVETKAVLAAQQAGLTRAQEAKKASKAADLALLAARAQATAGNLSTALQIAENAVNAKYGPIEDKIKVQQAQAEALKAASDALDVKLSKQEKIQLAAQQEFLRRQQQELDDKKAAQKTNVSLALTAGVPTKFVNQNGKFFSTADGTEYSTPQEFFKAAGVTSFEQAYQQGLVTDLNNQKLQDINFAQQAQAKYPDVRIPAGATPEEVAKIVQGSKIYRKDTYIAPSRGSAGLTSYQQLQAVLGLQKNLQTTTKAAQTIKNNYQNMLTAYNSINDKDSLNAASQAIITDFNKINDPSSVVRESEYARTPEGQSFLAQLQGKYTQIVQGGAGLTKENLKTFVDLAGQFADNANEYIGTQQQQSIQTANAFGLDPGLIVSTPIASTPGGGEIIEWNGKRYQTDANGDFDPNSPLP